MIDITGIEVLEDTSKKDGCLRDIKDERINNSGIQRFKPGGYFKKRTDKNGMVERIDIELF